LLLVFLRRQAQLLSLFIRDRIGPGWSLVIFSSSGIPKSICCELFDLFRLLEELIQLW